MKKFGAFVLGGCLGAGAMYLFAPRCGAESRQRVWEKVDTTLDNLTSEIVPPEDLDGIEPDGDAVDVEPAPESDEPCEEPCGEPCEEPCEETEVFEAHEIPHESEIASRADELLDRIESVRKRIVAQTLKNVSESLDAVSSAMEDVRDRATDIAEDVAEDVRDRAADIAEDVAEVAEKAVDFVEQALDKEQQQA